VIVTSPSSYEYLTIRPFRSYLPLLDGGPHDISMCFSLLNRASDEIKVDKIKSESGFMYELFCRIFSVFHRKDKATYDGTFHFKGRAVPTSLVSPLEELITVFSNHTVTGKTDWRFDPFLLLETSRILDIASLIIATH
jgi:hypothetical protein